LQNTHSLWHITWHYYFLVNVAKFWKECQL
jgi:hypothetical protein